MSSWANRGIPRKRDLSQIPEPFRPQIVPRAERPEVILSETFQVKEANEVIYPTFSDNFYDMYHSSNKTNTTNGANTNNMNVIKGKPSEPDRRQYPVKRIEASPAPNAIELRYDGKSYVFVILRHIRNTRDNDLWITAYNKVRQFYTNKIIIIDDNSSINTVNGKLVNTEVIMSEWNGAGEILPYYYFLQHKWADRMVFLHDSMFLHRRFKDAELEKPVSFHWDFTILDPSDTKKMSTYVSLLKNNEGLIEYLGHASITWKGCFGATTIIDKEIVESLEEQFGFFSKLIVAIRTRKDRQIFERLLGMVLFFEGVVDTSCSNFGDILSYPKAFESENQNVDTAAHILHQRGYDTAIIKVWRGR